MDWLVLQLADSGFPAGGFAHSGGLEVLVQLGEVAGRADLARFLEQIAWQAGHGALPLVTAAHADPTRFAELDALAEAFVVARVANRASRLLGRAFVSTSADVFANPRIVAMKQSIRARHVAGHHAPAFGAVLGELGVGGREAGRLLLHGAVRGAAAAAVRLGVIGPLDAQQLHFELGSRLEAVLDHCGRLSLDDLAQTAPLVEAYGSHHDGLYSRLFQS